MSLQLSVYYYGIRIPATAATEGLCFNSEGLIVNNRLSRYLGSMFYIGTENVRNFVNPRQKKINVGTTHIRVHPSNSTLENLDWRADRGMV